ncbi:AAA family ATPase [Maledivibacter halophilus]|uniref:AAA domain-containing protein n=1 Tax=Maledivibacter halophilus TaxID=36842 RepID=A0A1T5IQD0_9FIRM|nr:AAA family ATPase [Maledivibacter halophilus]SKC41377.1 AAA domain-containing protein [Maledivibacter halophilus]
MRINKFEIKDFGKFTESKIIDNIDSRVALFFGNNEAGKTTIFNLIKSFLYGFLPAKAQSHPYASWKNDRIEFTVFFKTDDGKDAIVHRKLLSRPQGEYMSEEKHLDIKNNSLPISRHISSEIYDKIYSLRVEDLIAIQGKAWEEVEDKLLAGYGTSAIRSTRDVLKDLREEYEKIWRESGRGKYLIKELEKEIRELKQRKKEAYSREEEIRRADQRINEIDLEIRKIKEKKIEMKALLNKFRKLIPIKKKLDQVEILKSRLIKEKLSKAIPFNIRDKISELKKRLEDIRKERNENEELLKEKENEKYILSSMDGLILKNKLKINLFFNQYTDMKNLKELINRVRIDIEKLKARLYHESGNFLAEKWNDEIRNKFELINNSELKILVDNYRNIVKKLDEMKLKRDLKTSNTIEIKLSKVYLNSLILSLFVIAIGFVLDNNTIKIVGLGILIYGITGYLSYINMKKNLKDNSTENELDKIENEIYKLENRLIEDKKRLIDYLKGIPISTLTIENMDEMFLPNIIQIKDMVYKLNELEKELSIYNREYNQKKEIMDGFIQQFYFDSYTNWDERVIVLKDRLDNLENKVKGNENIDKEIIQIKRQIKTLMEKEKETDISFQNYLEKLKNIGDGDIEKGLEVTDNNYRLRTKIDAIEEELYETSNIDNLIKEIKENEIEKKWIFSDYEVLRTEEKSEEINQYQKELEVEKARLEESINKLSKGYRLDEIESRINVLEDELERACEKRDRLVLLSEVIKFADQKFKEENQPQVLRNAGKYFNIITGGKYGDIYLEEEDGGNIIMVKEAAQIIPRRVVDTFSKGTLNQLYLSLRMALIDYLDKDKEALPVCFDELLVNWDDKRLNNSLELIKEWSENRQIFIFTCHDWMADKIESFLGVKRNVLE